MEVQGILSVGIFESKSVQPQKVSDLISSTPSLVNFFKLVKIWFKSVMDRTVPLTPQESPSSGFREHIVKLRLIKLQKLCIIYSSLSKKIFLKSLKFGVRRCLYKVSHSVCSDILKQIYFEGNDHGFEIKYASTLEYYFFMKKFQF